MSIEGDQFNRRLDNFLSDFSEDEQERILRYALDHIVPKLRGRTAIQQAEAQQPSSKERLFELWWEAHMPNATQEQAWTAFTEAIASNRVGIAAQQPTTPEPVAVCPTCGSDEPYTGACGTSGSDTKALCKRRTHPAHSVFLVRDIASLLGVSVPDVCNVLVALGYEPRRSTNAAISPDEALAVASRISPAPSVLKDDQIAALVNKVRDIARMFNDHQSLRERIAIELVPALKVSQEVKSNAERGRFLVGWLKRFGLLQAEFGQMGAGEKPENWWLLHAPWGIDKTRPFFGHGKTPEQAIDAAMLAAKEEPNV